LETGYKINQWIRAHAHTHTHTYKALGESDVQIPFEFKILHISGQAAISTAIVGTALFGN